jgi:hypothetical protein
MCTVKRGATELTDDERAAITALLGDRATGRVRDDLVAAIEEIKAIRRENSRRGALVLNALRRDSGSWGTVGYLTGLSRQTAQRWGNKVIPDEDEGGQ